MTKKKTTTEERWRFFQQWMEHNEGPWGVFGGDAMRALAMLPDDSVDCVVTDYAYESLEKHRKRGTTTRLTHSKSSSNDWFRIFPNARVPAMIHELYRVMAPNTHAYLHCDDETSDLLRMIVAAMVEERGKKNAFTWWKRIVWDKDRRGTGYHYAAQHEFVVFLEKGKRNLNDLGPTDVQRVKRVSKKSLGGRSPEPTEKPVELLKTFIANSSNPGDLILDPFVGSGSTGVAAVELGREFLGFDIKVKSLRIARERLAACPNG